jgi:hypothetical protein
MPHLGLVIIKLLGISFPVSFKKSDLMKSSPDQGPVAVLPVAPLE